MRHLSLAVVLAFASGATAQRQDGDAGSPTAAFAQFCREHGDGWVVQWHPATGTPRAIYGTGMALVDWRENSLDEARRHAHQLLVDEHDLLGLGDSDFVEGIGARMGRAWSFTFDQFFRGIPVIDGRVDVRIHRKGVVAMFGSRAWPVDARFDTTPAISEELATAIAWSRVGVPTRAAQPAATKAPRLVIWGDTHSPVRATVSLAWEVAVSNLDESGGGSAGRYYIDARSGAVLHFRNDRHECGLPGCRVGERGAAFALQPVAPPVPTTVTVMAWTRTGVDGYDPLVNTPLPGLVLVVPGVGPVTTDQNGQFTVDIAAPVNVTVGALDGRHHAPVAGSNAPSGVFTIQPGVSSTIQLLTATSSPEQGAHTTVSYWLDRVNVWCRGVLGSSPQLDVADNVLPSVNSGSLCNAFYLNNTVTFDRAVVGCANAAFSSIVVHEWGHGLDDRYGGVSNLLGDGLSEGWGDLLAMYLLDNPNYGSGLTTPGVVSRSGNNTKMYGTQVGVHDAGEVWMGFAWRYRENLRAAFGTPIALQVSEDTVVASIVANATNQAEAVLEVFLADDDDGNLQNGVPHYAQLSAAAIAKGMPYPVMPAASILHTPLADTADRGVPRRVEAIVSPNGGSLLAVRLHYDVGTGSQVRNMHGNGTTDGFVAMLPGISAGGVSYHFEVDHSSGVTVRMPSVGEFHYDLGTFQALVTEDFENGAPGWTTGSSAGTNEWQLGPPAGKSGSGGGGWVDPAAATSGTNVYGIDLGAGVANGAYANSTSQYLRSPVLDCSGRTGMRLRFKRWLSVERAAFDQATITVNGIPIWTNPAGANTRDAAWQSVEYAIPMADNNPAVQIEWRLTSDNVINLGGWQLDDVEVGDTFVAPLAAALAMLPEQAVQGGPMTLTVSTLGGPRPYLLAVGDTAGPTIVPGSPPLLVGGSVMILGASTNAVGLDVVSFTAPNVPSAVATFFYSQVLTIDATGANLVVSNAVVNMFTQTP